MAVTTRVARTSDLPSLGTLDRHLTGDAPAELVAAGRVLVAEMDGVVVGCLRWGLFWDPRRSRPRRPSTSSGG
jgi:hypothetical protein